MAGGHRHFPNREVLPKALTLEAGQRTEASLAPIMENLPLVAPSVATDPDTTNQGAVPRGPAGSPTASAGRVRTCVAASDGPVSARN